MATVQNDIYLKDNMTATLSAINNSLIMLTKHLHATDSAVKVTQQTTKGFTSTVGNAYSELASKVYLFKAAIDTLSIGTGFIDSIIRTDNRLTNMLRPGEDLVTLNNMIAASANNARSNLGAMGANVSKLGVLAKDAFGSSAEVIAFNEIVEKGFTLGGADTIARQAGMYQLVQALGSGRLQGDEFRSIIENAPMIAKAVADSLGVPLGALKELSTAGALTSDVIIGAVFKARDKINTAFENFQPTIGEKFTVIANNISQSIKPAITEITKSLNSAEATAFFNNMVIGVRTASTYLVSLVSGIIVVGAAISNNWSTIEPILTSVALGFTMIKIQALYAGRASVAAAIAASQAWIMTNSILIGMTLGAVMAVKAIKSLEWGLQVLSVVLGVVALGMTAAKIATIGFNAAIASNPIGALIMLAVALVYAVVSIVRNLITLYETNQKVAYSMIASWEYIKASAMSVVEVIRSSIAYMAELLRISSEVGQVSPETTLTQIKELKFVYNDPFATIGQKIQDAQKAWKPISPFEAEDKEMEKAKKMLEDAGKAGGAAFAKGVGKPTKEFLGDLTEYSRNVIIQKIVKATPIIHNLVKVANVNNQGDIDDWGDKVGDALLKGLNKVY